MKALYVTIAVLQVVWIITLSVYLFGDNSTVEKSVDYSVDGGSYIINEGLTGCTIERDELGTEIRCRHNGILTDSGYLFTDTIYSHKAKKRIIRTTLFSITSNK